MEKSQQCDDMQQQQQQQASVSMWLLLYHDALGALMAALLATPIITLIDETTIMHTCQVGLKKNTMFAIFTQRVHAVLRSPLSLLKSTSK